MGIAGGLWRVKPAPFCLFLGRAEYFDPGPYSGILSGRRFRFEKPTFS